MLKDSMQFAQADMAQRTRQEAVVEAESIIAAVSNALDSDGDLLGDTERSDIDAVLKRLQQQMSQGDAASIRASVEALNHATDGFAAARMDRNIQRALTGQNIADI